MSRKNGVANPWEYFTPEQLDIPRYDVLKIQRIVNAAPDAKIGIETIYNMCAYIYKNEVIRANGKRWYNCSWYEKRG